MTVERVGVVGGGIMGSGIAEVCAKAGVVVVVEADIAAANRARGRVSASLSNAVDRGKLEGRAAEAALARLTATDAFDALADRDIVIEAVSEDRQAKAAIFTRLAEVVLGADAILASNTSSIPIVELAVATGDRAGHVLGLHFFNPVPVLALVEVIPSLLTDPDVTARATAFAREQLGKEPIDAPDRAGFTVNALLIPYLLSAIRMFEQGLATADDIDTGMVKGCALRWARWRCRTSSAWTPSSASPRRCTPSTASSSSRPRRCSSGSSPPGCSAASPAAAFTTTRSAPRRPSWTTTPPSSRNAARAF